MSNNQAIRPMKIITVLVVLGVFVLGNAGITLSWDFGEKEETRVLPSKEGAITKKTTENVRIAGETFRVTESTTILDEKGRTLDLARLPVPCKVNIAYVKTVGDPEARKIQLLEVFPGAKTSFPPPIPE